MYNEENMSKERVQRNELLPFTESEIFCPWKEILHTELGPLNYR